MTPSNVKESTNQEEFLISAIEKLSTSDVAVNESDPILPNQETEKKPKEKKKKKKNGKVPKELLTPEYIEQKRKEREEKKRLKKEALIAKGIDPNCPQRSKYIKRELVSVRHEKNGEKVSISLKIMTYNLLAQALIRRTMFPDNGDILKWHNRSKVLLQELKDYDCDILCLQEVDFVQYNSFWKAKLGGMGYQAKYNRAGGKNHGVAIFFRESLFNCIDVCHINYDIEKSGDILPRTVTRNVGLILALAFKKDPNRLLTIGTTHLFWHPFGTYERTRQTYIVLNKCAEFEKRIRILHPEVKKVWKFFTGDFNSQPYDSPYLSITSKPIKYDDRCMKVISCSTSFQFSNLREGGSGEDEEGGNIEKHGEHQPKDPVPETFEATEEQLKLVKNIENLHNQLTFRAISMYSMGYRLVDPTNSGLDNDRNEPFFSNWAHTWRGLLDYIFFIKEWDISEDRREVDKIAEFECENDLVLEKLLKLPHPKEMGLGLPRENEYPSDHLCLIAQIGFKF